MNNDIKINMDGRGRATDNARIERFFRSLKYGKLYLLGYTTEEIHKAIEEFVREYKYERPHQSLDYRYPADVLLSSGITYFQKTLRTKNLGVYAIYHLEFDLTGT